MAFWCFLQCLLGEIWLEKSMCVATTVGIYLTLLWGIYFLYIVSHDYTIIYDYIHEDQKGLCCWRLLSRSLKPPVKRLASQLVCIVCIVHTSPDKNRAGYAWDRAEAAPKARAPQILCDVQPIVVFPIAAAQKVLEFRCFWCIWNIGRLGVKRIFGLQWLQSILPRLEGTNSWINRINSRLQWVQW